MPVDLIYIDDEAELASLFEDLFQSDKVKVRAFTDVKAALESAVAAPPDVIFIDFRLPNTTGDKVAQQMDPKIPKVLITGDLDVKTDFKFSAVFQKPYEPADILKFIESLKPNPKS